MLDPVTEIFSLRDHHEEGSCALPPTRLRKERGVSMRTVGQRRGQDLEAAKVTKKGDAIIHDQSNEEEGLNRSIRSKRQERS